MTNLQKIARRISNGVKKLTTLDKVFIVQVVLFFLLISGILPRSIVPFLALGLIAYVLTAPLEDGVLFFIRSIPFFIAIPITESFDSLNTWRLVSLAIFIKWILQQRILPFVVFEARQAFRDPLGFFKGHRVTSLLFGIGFLAALSLLKAEDIRAGITRLIYFGNLSMVGLVLYDLVRREKLRTIQIVRSIAIPTIAVVAFGYVQVAATYVMDIYQFMRIWGEGIQLVQFGTLWSNIAVRVGNTWLAYYGPQLSLRVFSLFPDSHSFPIFVLLGIPALFVLGIRRITAVPEILQSLKKMSRTYGNIAILWVPAAFLIIILSGTRGIWAASIPTVILTLLIHFYNRRTRLEITRRNVFAYVGLFLIMFFMLFAVAYPIVISPQFLLSKGDWGLLTNRLKSVIDFGETSNALRIEIWKQTLSSIAEHPFLGVGIGNYPTVLDQHVFLARAGSTAHNLYLHIAAELGIPALLLALAFFWLLFKRTYENFKNERTPTLLPYWAALLIYYPWVMGYLMTDAALFDERAFLLFSVTCATILSSRNFQTQLT